MAAVREALPAQAGAVSAAVERPGEGAVHDRERDLCHRLAALESVVAEILPRLGALKGKSPASDSRAAAGAAVSVAEEKQLSNEEHAAATHTNTEAGIAIEQEHADGHAVAAAAPSSPAQHEPSSAQVAAAVASTEGTGPDVSDSSSSLLESNAAPT